MAPIPPNGSGAFSRANIAGSFPERRFRRRGADLLEIHVRAPVAGIEFQDAAIGQAVATGEHSAGAQAPRRAVSDDARLARPRCAAHPAAVRLHGGGEVCAARHPLGTILIVSSDRVSEIGCAALSITLNPVLIDPRTPRIHVKVLTF